MTAGRGLVLAIAACSPFLAPASAAAEGPPTVGISAQDYPEDVRPTRADYDVRMRYVLAADGGVASCAVTRSSGVPGLDAASCAMLRERARFQPAAGAPGGEIRFHWLGDASLANGLDRGAPLLIGLPRTMTREELRAIIAQDHGHGGATIEADVSDEGAPLNCSVVTASGPDALARWMCARLLEMRLIPASDGAGDRRGGRFRMHVGWG